jgi:hypothetical protein
MPVKTGIQVMNSVRHTVGKLVPYSDTGRYPGLGVGRIRSLDSGLRRNDGKEIEIALSQAHGNLYAL